MSVHPTAIVDSGAKLGLDVEIGPYCIVGPDVTIGDNTWLQHHITLLGPTTVGPRNRFHAYCSIGQQSQDLKYVSEPTFLEIGSDNTFREFCTVNRATAAGSTTRVGNFNHVLAYSHIAHDCRVDDHVVFSNNTTLAGHVEVEDYAIIGGLTAVHQFCRIGKHSICGGCTKIVQDVPPFMIADGNPAEIRGVNLVGLERRGFAAELIRVLKESYRILYRSNLNTKQAIAELQTQFGDIEPVQQLIQFIERSQRGIIR
ncbi:MAG: acyl-ACP--UDP-N-acetylglucosamine O-acyltransferase [Verrucomicrobia bacterium]|nr:acyl-ACP--UDP-N-acetylglucosamine O-acyltransferase [Verrucomicrobiota bacterium]